MAPAAPEMVSSVRASWRRSFTRPLMWSDSSRVLSTQRMLRVGMSLSLRRISVFAMMTERGVLSSWEASATKARWRSQA